VAEDEKIRKKEERKPRMSVRTSGAFLVYLARRDTKENQ
jgi:hypothetical protein